MEKWTQKNNMQFLRQVSARGQLRAWAQEQVRKGRDPAAETLVSEHSSTQYKTHRTELFQLWQRETGVQLGENKQKTEQQQG